MRKFEPGSVVFHPGIGKTATSAIQKAGLALPVSDPNKACFLPFGVVGGAHHAFASNHPMFNQKVFDESVGRLVDFVKKRHAPTVISSEFLMRHSAEKIAELIGLLSSADIPIKAIFGIREYDAFLMSAYMQALKVGWGMRENETLEEYAIREMQFIRYPELVDRWASRIGDENIFLIDYDKNRRQFLAIFFGFLNLSLSSVPESLDNVNPSLPVQASEIIRNFDFVCSDSGARKRLVDELMRLTYRPEVEAFFQNIVSEVTQNKYAEDYAVLSKRYTWLSA